jgi:hypothetical protein
MKMSNEKKKGFLFGPRGGGSEAKFTLGSNILNAMIAGLESSIQSMQDALFECLEALEDELKIKFVEYYRQTIYTVILHSGFDEHTTEGILIYLEKKMKKNPDEIQTFDQLILSYEKLADCKKCNGKLLGTGYIVQNQDSLLCCLQCKTVYYGKPLQPLKCKCGGLHRMITEDRFPQVNNPIFECSECKCLYDAHREELKKFPQPKSRSMPQE